MDINGNVIFIPGATSGIGLALALALQTEGNEVVVGGRREDRLARIATDHPQLHTVTIDTTSAESIESAAAEVLAEHPDLNVLVAMAGIMRVEDWTAPQGFLADAEETITTNLLGPVRLIAAFIEHLRSRPAATIVTVSSGLGFVPLRTTPTYNATKAGIHLLSESLRMQLAETSVGVVELVPPAVATDLVPGQAESEWAMPLDEFVAEVVGLIRDAPDAHEIQVERVKFLRGAEARGDYAETVAQLNAMVLGGH